MIEVEGKLEAKIDGRAIYNEIGGLTPFGDQLRRVAYWSMMIDHTYVGDPNLMNGVRNGFLIDTIYNVLSDREFWPGEIDEILEPTVARWSQDYLQLEAKHGPKNTGFIPADLTREWHSGRVPRVLKDGLTLNSKKGPIDTIDSRMVFEKPHDGIRRPEMVIDLRNEITAE